MTVEKPLCPRCKTNEALTEGVNAGAWCQPCDGEIKAIQYQRSEYDARWRREASKLGIHPDMYVKDAEREAYGVFKEDIWE